MPIQKRINHRLDLTQKRLKFLLRHDSRDGEFYYRRVHFMHNKGDKAGFYDIWDQKIIGIDGYEYKCTRLAWLYHYGVFPNRPVVHISPKGKHDYRIKYLRLMSWSCVIINQGMRKDNTSGVKGITWDNTHKYWTARIARKPYKYSLGCFKSFTDAVFARYYAEVELRFYECTEDSSAYMFLVEHDLFNDADMSYMIPDIKERLIK